MSLYQLVKSLSLPPANLWLALLIVLIALLRWRRVGIGLLCALIVFFYVLATPLTSDRLGRAMVTVPPLASEPEVGDAQAIVVLSAGAHGHALEYGGVMVDQRSLERLAYAAYLHRRTGLPILVSGGRPDALPMTLAGAMKLTLENQFGVPVTWVENRSNDTAENARFSAAILRNAGLSSIVLVTHAVHMRRALVLFEATGLKVLPAPTAFPSPQDHLPAGLIPRMYALEQSEMTLNEFFAWILQRHPSSG